MKAKILIIEDVKEMSELIALYLGKEGIETRQAETAEIALEVLKSWLPDLAILDLNLPGMDGFEFLTYYRKTYSSPVLIVSARDADEDIITGLSIGADEFVTKPFSPRVLVARVRALMRRLQESPGNGLNSTISFGSYVLDFNSYTLKKENENGKFERIPLSVKEYAVLICLIENEDKPLTPEEIYSHVWKSQYGDLSAVAVYVQRLRKKIEENPSSPHYIQTVFGMGYKFVRNGIIQ